MECEKSDGSIVIHRIQVGNDTFASLTVRDVWEDNALLGFNIFNGLLLLLSNVAVIFGILKTCNEIKIPQKLFIMSSICGIIIGLFSLSSMLVVKLMDADCLALFIGQSLLDGVWFCESFFLITLSVTRLISVKSPFYDMEWRTVKRSIILGLLLGLAFLAVTRVFATDESLGLIITSILILGIICITLASSIITIIGLWRRPGRSLRANQSNSASARNRTLKPIIRIVTIQIAYLLCNLPLTLYSILTLNQQTKHGQMTISTLKQASRNQLWLIIVSEIYNGINSCLYIAQSKEIRRFYYRLFIKTPTVSERALNVDGRTIANTAKQNARVAIATKQNAHSNAQRRLSMNKVDSKVTSIREVPNADDGSGPGPFVVTSSTV